MKPGNPRSSEGALAGLPNLGPKSQQMLLSCGIDSLARLRQLGSVAAYAIVKEQHPSASLNLLWSLEGALTGLPWQQVAKAHRTSLLLCLEQHLQNRGLSFSSSGRARQAGASRG